MARGRNTRVFLDSFTSLDDLPRKQHGDAHKVLSAVMAAGGRFSIFDATENEVIAQTMTQIEHSGWVLRRHPDCGYPWIEWDLTEYGRGFLTSGHGTN